MNTTLRALLYGAAASLALAGAGTSFAAGGTMKSHETSTASHAKSQEPMVGGAPMYPSKTIVQNASKAANLTTLVAAVKEAGLADTLSGKGPFTVFAPTDQAFSKLPRQTVAELMKPQNKAKLARILTYHVVPGDIGMSTLRADLKKGDGKATFKTVEGETLTIGGKNGKMTVTDGKGDTAQISQGGVKQSNGTVYVIGSVLMPS